MILDARMEGKSISEMSQAELDMTADQIILQCSATTGCELPFTDFFANVLSKSLIGFLNKMGYSDLTLAEINLALELNLAHVLKMPGGIEIEEITFSGRCVNTTFMAKVLKNYMVIRNYLDRRLQNLIDGYE